jgi:hypothetical protein
MLGKQQVKCLLTGPSQQCKEHFKNYRKIKGINTQWVMITWLYISVPGQCAGVQGN